jgi:hypothetical protein
VANLDKLNDAAIKRPGERVIHVTNHASATALQADAARKNQQSHRVILNAKELSKVISDRRYDRWIANPMARVGGAARAIASASSAKVGEIEISLGNLANVDKQASTASTQHESIFVFENSIDTDGFGRLLSYYSTAEPSKMPTIIVAADKDMQQLEQKLSCYSDNFSFHEVYGATSRFWTPSARTTSMSLSGMVQGLIGNNTLAVANTQFSLEGVNATDFDELSQNLSAAYAVIRSVNFEYNKFASAELAAKALTLLDGANVTRLSAGQKKTVHALRILFTLWDLYLNEDKPEKLDQAIELSSLIESDILKAHCQRLVNLSAGYSEFSRHSLEQAELTFRRFDQDPMAIYCKNNALLNVMHQEGRTTDQFTDLIDEAFDKCPTMFSMVRLLNNAGVGAMLDSRFEQALAFFDKSSGFNALPIHRLGLDTNAFLCRFSMGESIHADDLDRLVTRIERANIDRRYGYHQAIILFNILRMQEQLGHSSAMTRTLLRERSFMAYGDVLDGKVSVAHFLEARLPTTVPQAKYKGQRGDFILRTDLVPIIHFGWS